MTEYELVFLLNTGLAYSRIEYAYSKIMIMNFALRIVVKRLKCLDISNYRLSHYHQEEILCDAISC